MSTELARAARDQDRDRFARAAEQVGCDWSTALLDTLPEDRSRALDAWWRTADVAAFQRPASGMKGKLHRFERKGARWSPEHAIPLR